MCANRSPIRSRIASEYSRRRVLTAVGVVAGGGAALAVAPVGETHATIGGSATIERSE